MQYYSECNGFLNAVTDVSIFCFPCAIVTQIGYVNQYTYIASNVYRS